MPSDPPFRQFPRHPANLEGWHPESILELRDPALDELLGVAFPHRFEVNPVAIREDNNRRAGWALIGFRAYSERVHGDSAEPLDQGIGDLIGDLMHLCDLLELDFDALADHARGDHEAELEGIF